MKKEPLYKICIAFLLAGCGSVGITPKSEKYQAEMTLQKTRADIEEIKHDLHSQMMELSILKGKALNQEDLVTSLKKDTFDLHQNKLDHYASQITTLEKKISLLEKRNEEIHSQLQLLVQTSNETHKALAQSKEKLNEMERTMAGQSKSLNEMTRLKKTVDKITQMIEEVHKQFAIETNTLSKK